MKLKRFKDFILIKEYIHYHDIDLDENSPIVLVDGEIYYVESFDIKATWDHEPADPEVGIYSSYDYLEEHDIDGINRASLLIDPEIKSRILELFSEDEISKELASMGIMADVSDDIINDIAFGYPDEYQNHWKQLTHQELRNFSKRFIELLTDKTLKVLSGANFKELIDNKMENVDQPDRDNY